MFQDLYFVYSDAKINFSLGQKTNCVECVVGGDNSARCTNHDIGPLVLFTLKQPLEPSKLYTMH